MMLCVMLFDDVCGVVCDAVCDDVSGGDGSGKVK